MAISVELGPQLEAYVAKLVTSGRFNSESEVLREGVRIVHERERRLAALDAAIARGLAESNMEKFEDADDVFDALDAMYADVGN